MRRRFRIGLDVDDCLAAFITEFARLSHEMYGTRLDLQPTDWLWSNFLLSSEQINLIWDRIQGTHNFWLSLKKLPTVDAYDVALLDEHILFFITSRAATKGLPVEKQTASWLQRVGFSHPSVIVSANKGELAEALQLDAFIDDRPENCLAVRGMAPKCKVFLMDSSHNRTFQSLGVKRVTSLSDFCLELYVTEEIDFEVLAN